MTQSTKWASAALILAIAAVAGVLIVSTTRTTTELASCTPCVMGPQCHAGCLTEGAIRPAPTQALSMVDPKERQMASKPHHASLWAKQQEIENVNKRLLQLSPLSQPSELGSVLDEAVKQVVRAEAAEVKLRRQANLEHGENVQQVYQQLSSSDKELFALRAKEFELALHEADKSIMLAEQVMKPLVHESSEHGRAAKGPAVPKPSWSSDLSHFLSSVVSDGHGRAWGVSKAQSHARLQQKAALPGVVTDNWSLNKGALDIHPKGDDAKLPGVKTHGW
eukprot:CAMPEP_0196721338 /NCGR_PEP_ID=MMETSP1091-20130531/3931_1 /TAXON_ID=302021 /ORGANISM="Rhodomonas sp., Strain CCMP768" /LENGTH=277 /DNA_ID=CAMNT_0042062787 /DNA_START=13 /DNA_END=846 /DNA_ORIENTATION=-